MRACHIANVLPLRGAAQTDHGFDYNADDFPALCKGDIVLVPFGRGSSPLLGVVLEVKDQIPERNLKNVYGAVDPHYRLSPETFELAFFMKRQSFCTLADAFRAMLPSGLSLRLQERYTCQDPNALSLALTSYEGSSSPTVTVYTEENALSCPVELAQRLLRQKQLRKTWDYRLQINARTEKIYRLNKDTSTRLPLPTRGKEKYEAILSRLKDASEGMSLRQLKEQLSISQSPLNTLLAKGYLMEDTRRVYRSAYHTCLGEDSPLILNDEQEACYQEIRKGVLDKKAAAYLLHGVTGSGKTKVMLKVIDCLLSEGKSVIFLVPEISLTSQTYVQLSARYRDLVTVIHSGLSDGERADAWLQIRNEEKRVVLGTRSAVFAPCPHLGALILDEEHDTSYKSDSAPRYHTRDIARFRCAKNNAVLLLSSATPDVESYYKAQNGIYKLLTMKKRYRDAKLPEVRIEDLRRDLRDNPDRLLGSQLKSQIESNLSRKEQVILFVDRRGYQRFASCVTCGHVPVCTNCSVALTLHNGRSRQLVCHYCGYSTPAPQQCPSCQGKHLLYHGYGSQKVEEELKNEFPSARILRMDADSVKGKLSHDSLLTSFRNGEADILLGTQMVAKGHDFPKVTLVGVVMADTSLYMSDYRAYEHSFSLLTQVIGRAGRSHLEGRAFIQTLNPYHEILTMCRTQDYEAFYRSEIALRKALVYPPFCNICVFGFSAEEEGVLNEALKEFSLSLQEQLQKDPSLKLIVYGPFEAPIYKLKNVYRKRFLIKYKPDQRVLASFHTLADEYGGRYQGSVSVHVDINPSLV